MEVTNTPTIVHSNFNELFSNPSFADIVSEYAAESAIEGLPSPVVRMDTYATLEKNGVMTVFLAFHGNNLIGFITLLFNELPHFGIKMAMSESFFVVERYRSTGAGLKLLRTAEKYAEELGSCGLLVSAPFEGKLAQVLERTDYVETNRVFFKRLQHE